MRRPGTGWRARALAWWPLLGACALLLTACADADPAASPPASAGRSPQPASVRPAPPPAVTGAPALPLLRAFTAAPAPATTPTARLAAQITAAETAIRDPATPDARLAPLGHIQQQVYRTLARRPRLLPEVLRLLPARLRGVVQANALAAIELHSMGRPRPDRPLPRWRIVAPPPAAALLAEYRTAEAELGVPWEYLAAIHVVETRVGRIRGTSSAGAKGPMQFLPSTWRRYGAGGDINAVHDAVPAAARLLRAHGAPADMAAALYAYNHSRHYVRAVTAYARQIQADPRAYLGYYEWQVYWGDDIMLPEGYPARPAVSDKG